MVAFLRRLLRRPDLSRWQHAGCPDPHRCHCDCPACMAAWKRAGSPMLESPETEPCHIPMLLNREVRWIGAGPMPKA
jgi:hypothetical protein